jgi:NAD(P)-dependent dehydrogenase (short-subunit alcohol dehydrogenase family)
MMRDAGMAFRGRDTAATVLPDTVPRQRGIEMQGKVVVITGATSGIGEVAAQRLAGMGARLVLIARDPERGQAALSRLPGGAGAHTIHYGDLSRISQMKRVASQVAAAEPRIDVLINNAGALFNSRKVTEDNLESTFATNHMAYFVLTLMLRAPLLAGSPSRVVSTASDAHRGNTLDFDDLQATKGYSGFKVYGRSKLCNILFTRELARRWGTTGITANCLHPGFVATRFGDSSGGIFSGVVRVAKAFAISPEKGAETIVYLATSPEVAGRSGEYFYKCSPAVPTDAARDDAAAGRLWTVSEEIAGFLA